MRIQTGFIIFAALLLAACNTAPKHNPASQHPASSSGGGYLPGDGPGTEDAAKLGAVPDAVPRDEPLHHFANRPYEALGKHYVPLTATGNYKERGIVSWYGKKFHGQRTSSGEVYNMYAMSAAHKTLPIPSYARVTNLSNGKSVIVRVNDRGPFLHERIMDVSYAAAYKLGIIASGSGEVEVESISPGQSSPVVQTVASEPIRVEPLTPVPAPNVVTTPIAAAPSVDNPVAGQAYSYAGGKVYLQLGSFRSAQSADGFLVRMRNELGDLGKQVVLYTQGGLTRVNLGPYVSTEDARKSADKLESRLGFKPFVSLH